MKAWLILIALGLLVGFVVLGSLGSDRDAPIVLETTQGPAFEVHVVKPWLSRPLGGLLPEEVFDLPPSVLRFGHASPGARIVSAGVDHLELGADGWQLHIEADGQGRVLPGTRIVFPLDLSEQVRSLRCRPADQAFGQLRATRRPGANVLDGEFLVGFSDCEDARTGEALGFPPGALTVRGRFAGLPLDAP
jgi:hypothetical protein